MIISWSGQPERTSSLQQHVRRHNILNHVPSCGTLFSEIILKIGPHNYLIILIPFHYSLKVKYSSTWYYLLWLRQQHKYLHTWMHTRIYRNVGMLHMGFFVVHVFLTYQKWYFTVYPSRYQKHQSILSIYYSLKGYWAKWYHVLCFSPLHFIVFFMPALSTVKPRCCLHRFQ